MSELGLLTAATYPKNRSRAKEGSRRSQKSALLSCILYAADAVLRWGDPINGNFGGN
jgi:hypothetical protein